MCTPLSRWTPSKSFQAAKYGATVAALAVSLVLDTMAAHSAGPIRPFQLGLWSGGAYTNEQTGGFSHCAASVPYKSGISMFVAVNRLFGWSLGFYDPQWNLTPASQIPIQIHFDGGPGFNVTGTVLRPMLVEVPMPDNSSLINTFRKSFQMSALAQNQGFMFNLNGTSRLMVQLVECVRTALALDTSQPPGGLTSPQQPPVPTSPSEQTVLEETRLATNFLLAAQLPDAHLVGGAETPLQLASYGAVWKAENAVGAVKIYLPKPQLAGLDVAAQLIANDAQSCKGKFASGRYNELVDSDVVFRAVTACSDSEHETQAQYFIAPRHEGGFVAFSILSTTGSEKQAMSTEQKVTLFKKAALTAVGKD